MVRVIQQPAAAEGGFQQQRDAAVRSLMYVLGSTQEREGSIGPGEDESILIRLLCCAVVRLPSALTFSVSNASQLQLSALCRLCTEQPTYSSSCPIMVSRISLHGFLLVAPLFLLLSSALFFFHGITTTGFWLRAPRMVQEAPHTGFQPAVAEKVMTSNEAPAIFIDVRTREGIGDQIQQHLLGVALAQKHGAVYVYNQLVRDRGYDWDDFFGLSRDELTWPEVLYISPPALNRDQINHTVIEYGYRPAADNEMALVEIIRRCRRQGQECLITLVTTLLPYGHEEVICDPTLNLQFRKKYCLQRVQYPVPSPALDRVWNQNTTAATKQRVVPVALHHRSGDLGYTVMCSKKQPLSTIINTMPVIQRVLGSMGYAAQFHVYSEPPITNTRDKSTHNVPDKVIAEYFRPLFTDSTLVSAGIVPFLHVHMRTELAFHRMVTAPIFVGSGSGFSLVAALLRVGVSLVIRSSCGRAVRLNQNGTFDEQDFTRALRTYAASNRLDEWRNTMDVPACIAAQPWQPLNSYRADLTFREQNFTAMC